MPERTVALIYTLAWVAYGLIFVGAYTAAIARMLEPAPLFAPEPECHEETGMKFCVPAPVLTN